MFIVVSLLDNNLMPQVINIGCNYYQHMRGVNVFHKYFIAFFVKRNIYSYEHNKSYI